VLKSKKHTHRMRAPISPEKARELQEVGDIGKIVIIQGRPARFEGVQEIDGCFYAVATLLTEPEDN